MMQTSFGLDMLITTLDDPSTVAMHLSHSTARVLTLPAQRLHRSPYKIG